MATQTLTPLLSSYIEQLGLDPVRLGKKKAKNLVILAKAIHKMLGMVGSCTRDVLCELLGFEERTVMNKQLKRPAACYQLNEDKTYKFYRYNTHARRTTVYDMLTRLERMGKVCRWEDLTNERGRPRVIWGIMKNVPC